MFETGQQVEVIKTEPLKGNDIAPPLKMGDKLKIEGIILDKARNQHLDVGIASKHSYITSHETGEELINGHIIHWCHPSRFKLV